MENFHAISFENLLLASSLVLITLSILVLSGILQFNAYQMIPVGGMVISGGMIAIGLCYRQMLNSFQSRLKRWKLNWPSVLR